MKKSTDETLVKAMWQLASDIQSNDGVANAAIAEAAMRIHELSEKERMLDFLLGQFQMHSPKMGRNHSWLFRYGWPWSHAKGENIEAAIRNAMAEVEREKAEHGPNKGSMSDE